MSGQKDQVLEAAAKIVADFGAHKKESYFSNFSEAATFIFHTHNSRLGSRAEYQKLWDSWETDDGFRVHGCKSTNQLVQSIGADFAIFTHDVESSVELGGETSTVFERETIVFEKQDGSWIVVHEHLSPSSGS
jgi:ketosteroid isomerase-like protein